MGFRRKEGLVKSMGAGGGGGVSVYASFFFSIFIQRDIVELLCNLTPSTFNNKAFRAFKGLY